VLFGVLNFEGEPWILEDGRDHKKVNLPTKVLVGRRHIVKIRNQLKDPTSNVLPVIVHTHEYVQKRVSLKTPDIGTRGIHGPGPHFV
jgi:hypothetical protein